MFGAPGNQLVPLSLLGWPFLCLVLFGGLPPRRAVLVALIAGFLFLPRGTLVIQGLPNYDKHLAVCLGALLGVLLFDPGRLLTLRMHLMDLPVLVLSLVPAASSLSNNLGSYDAVSAAVNESIKWLLPYMLGRMYFTTPRAFRELAVAIFLGGLLYVPLCLWEIRMSPQLALSVYGIRPNWIQNLRGTGFRPIVFFGHGLPLSLFMADAAVMGFWLWRSRSLSRVLSAPMRILSPTVIVTTYLCRSALSMSLLTVGMVLFPVMYRIRTLAPILLMALVPLLFVTLRATAMWDAQELIDWSETIFGPDRAGSFAFRVQNDTLLAEKALERPLLGWGGWGHNRIFDEQGRDISITDSLWVIRLGTNGLVGLVALLAFVLLPPIMFVRRMPSWAIRDPDYSPAVAGAMLMCFWMIDLTQNATVFPTRIAMAGALTGMVAAAKHRPWRRRAERAASGEGESATASRATDSRSTVSVLR